MDSDDWTDLGDDALWYSGPGVFGLVIGLVLALIFYGIAASVRSDEDKACETACGTKGEPVVVKTNHQDMTCMCKWKDGSLHAPVVKTNTPASQTGTVSW